jgi:hypothetical protein
MFSQMAKDIKQMAEAMTSSLERIASQSSNNGDKLEQVLKAQGERKAVCARQDMRIEACEKESVFILEEIRKAEVQLDERTKELRTADQTNTAMSLERVKELWAHNTIQDERHAKLAKLVYTGLGGAVLAVGLLEVSVQLIFHH